MDKWYMDSKTDESIIISSRIRLARNIKKYNFPIMLKSTDADEMLNETVVAIKNDRTAISKSFDYINMLNINETQGRSLLEKHIISPVFLNSKKPRGLLLQDDEKVSIMINEEDHIRIQSINPGDNMENTWIMADRIDNLLEETLEYAFNKDYGYLTSCPTNTGTGLRASFMVHLPMLEAAGQIKSLMQTVGKFGMALRGIYGEGTEPMGSIYQLSNQVTMGKSENEIIESLKNITMQIIDKESCIREITLKNRASEMEDRVYRSYGVLKYAKKISGEEAMKLFSDVRLGFITGLLKVNRPSLNIYNIMMNIQPGNLQLNAGKALSEQERDIVRAEYINELLGG